MADTFFVAQLGNSASGAVGVVFAVQSIIQAFGFGIGMGAGTLISRHLGRKETDKANAVASSAFALAILLGTLVLLAGLLNLNAIMRFFGSTDTILPFACDYGMFILIGAPLMCSTFVLNNVLRAEGRATASMIGIGVGGVLNIALDPLLIFTFDMGIQGAAVATISSQCVSFVLLLSFFVRGRSVVEIAPRFLSRRFSPYFLILKEGFPTICRQGLGSLSTTLLNIQVRPFGDEAISAISIANKIYILLRMAVLGIGQGFQPVAGYNFGAGRYKRVKKAFFVAVVIGSAVSCAAALVAGFFGGTLISWFRPGDTEVIGIGGRTLLYLSISLPFLGYSTYVNQLYQSLGYVAGATVLASCRQGIFFIPLIYLLPSRFGLQGIQMTQAAADLCTFAFTIPFHIWFFRKVLSCPDRTDE